MNDVTYEPKAKNKSAKHFVWIFVIVAAIVYASAGVLPIFGGLLRLCAVLLLTAAIFVAFKYLFTSYVYSVFSDEGKTPACLLVEQRQGRRSSLVCRVPLSAVLSLAPYDGKGYPTRCYVFIATMRGGEYQLLRVREAGREFCVKLEADGEFLAALATAISLEKTEEN